jgi:hypothetical protein
MRQRKLRSDGNWHGALKQNEVKQTGVKQGLGVYKTAHFTFLHHGLDDSGFDSQMWYDIRHSSRAHPASYSIRPVGKAAGT